MARLKKPIDYIRDLRANPDTEVRKVGELLYQKYKKWIQSLKIRDLQDFIDLIQRNKEKIGLPQYFGKFRAYSMEEYIFRLIKTQVNIPEGCDVFWGKKNKIYMQSGEKYYLEMDVSIGRRLEDDTVFPFIVVDCKVEVDASRLKTTAFSFILLKSFNPNVKCFLVYMKEEIDPLLIKLAERWIDGIYQLNIDHDESEPFLEKLRNALKSSGIET